MRTFDRTKHRAIVFDEAASSLIVAHKQVFQAGLDASLLGQSKTNSLAYSVWLHGVPLIVSTNSWLDDVDHACDREWLLGNSVVIWVDEPMYFDRELLQLTNDP